MSRPHSARGVLVRAILTFFRGRRAGGQAPSKLRSERSVYATNAAYWNENSVDVISLAFRSSSDKNSPTVH